MERLKKIWRDPVVSTLIAAAILAGVTGISVFFFQWWEAIRAGTRAAFVYVTSTTEVQNWFLGLLLLAIILFLGLLLIIAIAVFKEHARKPTGTEPNWERDYREDLVDGIRWRWKNLGTYVDNLSSFCPKCDCQFEPEYTSERYGNFHTVFYCVICKTTVAEVADHPSDIDRKVTRIIQQRARTGEWLVANRRTQKLSSPS